MPKKKKDKKNRKNLSQLTESILKILLLNPTQLFNYKQIAAQLGVNDANSRNQIIKKLKDLHAQDKIEEVERGKFRIKKGRDYHLGVIDISSRAQGYVWVEELNEEIFINRKNLNRAFHGDQVEVYVFKRRKQGRLEGEITQVVQRKRTEFVGVIELHKNFAFVAVADSKMYTDFFVPIDLIGAAKNHDKVLVSLVEWPEHTDSPIGKVVQVFGKQGEHQTEMHAILAQYGLPYQFPDEVAAEAQQLDTRIQETEIQKRRDFRDVLTFTIDPADAKDFDDALSFQKLQNGNYEIGIHIADVSHYVVPGTQLDEEAYERATSVYLVDRVVPMLPEILSNEACSLRPHEEKYTFSAVFEINSQAQVINQWFGRTVINSDARFSYEEAQYLIESDSNTIDASLSLTGKTYTVDPSITEAVLTMDKLAKKLRRQRMHHGAISFDKIEVKFKLDEQNNPIGVYFKESKDSNHLIEEFMLLANRKVAEFIGKQTPKKTFVYRVHDEPDEEKLASLQTIIKRFGYSMSRTGRKSTNQSLNRLLQEVKGKKEQNLIDTLAIRSMSKAEYATQNIGHYGLAFDYYTHFTSPIRRYPDILVHRLLQHYLDGKSSVGEEEYQEKCHHCSDMENLAAHAERDSIKYMQIKFMIDHQKEQFLGVISGVTEWGIYVEIIENKCEGMVSVRDLKDDHYVFEKEEYALVGSRTHNTYQLGDEVYVRVKNADLIKKHLDFTLVGKKEV